MYGADRSYFIQKLRRSPWFAIRHGDAMLSAICRRVSTRLRAAVSFGRGGKRWPHHVLSEGQKSWEAATSGSNQLHLPSYRDVVMPLAAPAALESRSDAQVGQDQEVYFANNRWAHLVLNEANLEADMACLAEIQVWIEAHKSHQDPAWETYSTCERVANLLVFLSLREMSVVSAEIVSFLCASLNRIYENLEYYGEYATNNHILNNARAMIMCGVALAHDEAISSGVMLLRYFCPRMIDGDGFLRERSSHYQMIVFRWLCDAGYFLAISPKFAQDAMEIKRIAASMSKAAGRLCEGGELLATIGDVSPDFSPLETSFLLKKFYSHYWREEKSNNWITRGGWFCKRAYNSVVLGNFGPEIFPSNFPTHGHADYTSFVWLLGSRRILTDPGRYRYTADPLSRLQISARAHNAVLVNGFAPLCESVIPGGAWYPQPYSAARLSLDADEAQITMSHAGYARGTPVAWHRREIRIVESGLTVIDLFDGSGVANLDVCWQFGSEFTRFETDNSKVVGDELEVSVFTEAIIGGQVSNPEGHWGRSFESPSYGQTVPAINLVISQAVTLPATIKTSFIVTKCAE